MLKEKLTQDQLASLSEAQSKAIDSTEELKEKMQKLLGSREKEWDARDKLISASLEFDEAKATAGVSTSEMNQLGADLKNAELTYEAALSNTEKAEQSSQEDQVTQPGTTENSNVGMILVYTSMGVVVVAIAVLMYHSKYKAPSQRAPPLGTQSIAVALEGGDGGEVTNTDKMGSSSV